MKKMIVTATVIVILAILLIPIPMHLKDGGTVKYQAILYSVYDVHRLVSDSEYEDGLSVELLGIEIYNNVKKLPASNGPSREDTEPTEETYDPVIYEAELSYANIPKTNKIYQNCLNIDKLPENVRHLPVYRFDTAKELEGFKQDFAEELVMDSGYDEVPSFNEVTEKYDGVFFKENTLLLVYIDSTNCTHRYGVDNIAQEDGYFCIYLKETTGAEAVDAAMSGWVLTVPVSKDSVTDSTEFDAILNHSYDTAGHTAPAFREPPVLTVSSSVSEIEAMKGTFSWMYTDENGEGVAIMADSSHPLLLKEHMPVLALVPATSANVYPLGVKLQFGSIPNLLPPDNITVRCWEEKDWGNTEAVSEDIPTNSDNGNISLELKDGSYIYEVIAEWNGSKSASGSVCYSFYTVKASANAVIRE